MIRCVISHCMLVEKSNENESCLALFKKVIHNGLSIFTVIFLLVFLVVVFVIDNSCDVLIEEKDLTPILPFLFFYLSSAHFEKKNTFITVFKCKRGF